MPVLAGVILAIQAAEAAPARFSEAEYERLLALVRPESAEPWQEVRWRVDLESARLEAAAAGKPVFLWTMNGHPLGCT